MGKNGNEFPPLVSTSNGVGFPRQKKGWHHGKVVTYVIGALLILVGIQAAAIIALLVRGARRVRAAQALLESERRFRFLVDRAPVMIWTARPDSTLDYLNSTCVEFSGLPIEKLLDNGWLEAVHPDDRDHSTGIYVPAIEARKPFLFEYRVRRADGAYRWLLATGAPRSWPDGSFAGYIGCDVDITERKEAEDVIFESQRALEVSHLEIGQLAGRLLTAHEDERRRLARELHDDLTQRLARLAIDAGRLERGGSARRSGGGYAPRPGAPERGRACVVVPPAPLRAR